MNESSYLKRAEALKLKDRLEDALELIDQGLKAYPQSEALLLQKASILMDSFDDVEAAFSLLLSIERSFGDQSIKDLKKRLGLDLLSVYLLLTDCFRLKNDLREALNHALMAKKIAPNEQAAILALTTAYFELGDFDKAKEVFRTLKDEPKAESFWLLGQILCAEGLITEADEMFLAASDDCDSYHQPKRLSQEEFIDYVNHAIASLPKDIADVISGHSVQLMDIVPFETLLESRGQLVPTAPISIGAGSTIFLYQRNIENMVEENSLVELIASILLHELRELIART